MDLVIYYASGQDYYRLKYNEKRVEINGLRNQYLDEFYEILDERNLWENVLPYLPEQEEQ